MEPNSITITYLSKVTFASLNGSDKEVDNINTIKKVRLENGEELPYVSSQAIRRALRDKLKEMGNDVSPVDSASVNKGAPKTALNPVQYIDDDLFGYMDATAGQAGEKGSSTTRTSPIRVESLVALSPYKEDLDFATNFMGKAIGSDPNIFETEIHSGVYRGTILIELDRIGCGEGFETQEENSKNEINNKEKAKRVLYFLDSFKSLWSSGRQTRFLADISPKFIAAAYMKSKNPIFLESVKVEGDNNINIAELETVVKDYKEFIEDDKYVFAAQSSIFNTNDEIKNLADGFNEIKQWVKSYYEINNEEL